MKNAGGWSSIFILLLIAVIAYVFYKKITGGGFGLGFGFGTDGDTPGLGSSIPTSGSDEATADAPTPEPVKKQGSFPKAPATRPARPEIKRKPYNSAAEIAKLIAKNGMPALYKIKDSNLPFDAQVQAIAKRVSAANKDAAKHHGVGRAGTSTAINQSLNELKNLNDVDFGKVFKCWQLIDGFTDPLKTNLASANITNTERSNFLNRLYRLGLAN